MAKIIVVYYSVTANTRKMAELIAEGIQQEGVTAALASAQGLAPEELLKYDGIVLGSPVYYGGMAAQMKRLLDESVKLHGKLDGKVGAAFASSANIAGGNETTVLDILNAMLIHGMIIQGDPLGSHYGPVSIEAPDKRAQDECRRWGSRLAKLVKRLGGDTTGR